MTTAPPLVSRNSIMDALAALFEGMDIIVAVRRRFLQPNIQSMSAQMPMLCLTKPVETYPPRDTKQLPAKRTFMCEAFIWFAAGQDQSDTPDETLCDILDQLDSVMRPPATQEAQTLGGLVDLCYIEGDVTCVAGDVDGLGLIHVPIKIIVP